MRVPLQLYDSDKWDSVRAGKTTEKFSKACNSQFADGSG